MPCARLERDAVAFGRKSALGLPQHFRKTFKEHFRKTFKDAQLGRFKR